jgi:RNA polymerase sigma factor (sigma-70 family)
MSSHMQAQTAFDDAPRPPEQHALARDAETAWPDKRLVSECVRGNEKAWAMLLEKYKRLIYSIPLKYGLSRDEATDIFQDVCLELLSELPRLREPRALPKWLIQVTSHKCLRARTASARNTAPSGADDPAELNRVADTQPLSEQIILDVEREHALREAVATLAPRCRRLVEMLFFETPARSYRDVAQSLQLETGSIGFIRGRCLKRLRIALEKHGFR